MAGQVKLLFPFPAFGTWSPKTALNSARKLRELSPALLAVGHGRMLPAPLSAMDQAIEDAASNVAAKEARTSHA